ncbi:MAG: hypothetical protein KF887_03955 [Paracoccaceae bacterium]|nr:MAG: hypothetical protein KF887_03955 [Paracoccaceae bacterium]
MELLLILLPLALLGAVFSGGSDDDAPAEPPPSDDRVITGSADDEDLAGGPGNDLIFAAAAPDIVTGNDGDDMLFGEGGNDTVQGGAGEDILLGGNGDDEMRGGAGRDLLMGGAGRDLLSGDSGDDVLIGGSDVDTLHGGAGNDILSGVEIGPADLDDPELAQVVADLNTLVGLRYGADTSARFAARVERSVLSANDEIAAEAGAPAPDLLYGGLGADTIFGDHGDLMVGGGTDTADLFVAVMRADAEPVTIADFEAADRIEIDPNGLPPGDISFTLLDEGTLIRVGDAAVAVVTGVRDFDLLAPRVTLTAA